MCGSLKRKVVSRLENPDHDKGLDVGHISTRERTFCQETFAPGKRDCLFRIRMFHSWVHPSSLFLLEIIIKGWLKIVHRRPWFLRWISYAIQVDEIYTHRFITRKVSWMECYIDVVIVQSSLLVNFDVHCMRTVCAVHCFVDVILSISSLTQSDFLTHRCCIYNSWNEWTYNEISIAMIKEKIVKVFERNYNCSFIVFLLVLTFDQFSLIN